MNWNMALSRSFFSALDWAASLVVELDNYFPAENSIAALVDFAHFDCYSMRGWGGFVTLHCRCWSMDCSSEEIHLVPHSSLVLALQMEA